MRNIFTQSIRAFALFSFLILLSAATFAQVGIGTEDPLTTLDVNGALSLREGTPLVLSNGNNNFSLAATPNSQYRITGPTAAFAIRNITPVNGSDGQLVTLINTTAFPMTILHDVGTAARRIYCPGQTNLFLPEQYSTVTLQYNNSLLKWTVQSYSKREADLTNVTDITRYLLNGPTLNPNTVYSLTVTIPGVTTQSTGIITITGNWGTAIFDDLTIHNIEMRTNEVRFAVSNNTPGIGGNIYPLVQFNLTVIR